MRLHLIYTLLSMLFLMYSCTKDEAPDEYQIQSGTFTDERDGTTYKTVKIGNQWWMAENLAYKTKSGSYAYEDDENNIQKYGRLYTLDAAKDASPDGWHLPTDAEWEQLADYIENDRDEYSQWETEHDLRFVRVGKYLKSKSGWSGNGSGNDYYGFNALPSGGFQHSYCCDVSNAFWWSDQDLSTQYDWTEIYYWGLEWDDSALSHTHYFNMDKYDRYSVRCVKD